MSGQLLRIAVMVALPERHGQTWDEYGWDKQEQSSGSRPGPAYDQIQLDPQSALGGQQYGRNPKKGPQRQCSPTAQGAPMEQARKRQADRQKFLKSKCPNQKFL